MKFYEVNIDSRKSSRLILHYIQLFSLYKSDARNVQRRSWSQEYKQMNWIHNLVWEFNMPAQHIYEQTEARTS